jgi:histone H3/H4
MAKKKANKKKAAKGGPEMVLVGSKVKAAIKAAGCNSSADVLDSLNNMVHWYISQAAKRATSNGRKTVRGHDIVSM